MLEHLAAEEGLPSQKLIQDLRTLCKLPGEALAQIASAISKLREGQFDEDIPDTMIRDLQTIAVEPETLSAAIGVAFFLWKRWASRRLTKAQIAADLASIGISQGEQLAVSPLLDAMESKIESLRRNLAIGLALGTGIPQIKAVTCVVDARAVFRSQHHDEELGEDQAYFDFDQFVPVVILEALAELNGEKTTHSFVLNEKELDQLSGVVRRTQQRLLIVKKQLAELAARGQDTHDE